MPRYDPKEEILGDLEELLEDADRAELDFSIKKLRNKRKSKKQLIEDELKQLNVRRLFKNRYKGGDDGF